MSFMAFLEEKIVWIFFQTVFILLTVCILGMWGVPAYHIVLAAVLSALFALLFLSVQYFFAKKKYNKIVSLVDNLEEKYLIAELLKKPDTLENRAYFYALRQACKSMNDRIGELENRSLEYREYIESFVHEMKTPIAALALTFDNNGSYAQKSELDKINHLVEQILFFARSDTAEKDYFVKEVMISEAVHSVILKYRYYIRSRGILLNIHDLDYQIYTDEKWLLFILSQILQNSIKYLEKEEKEIEIFCRQGGNSEVLVIRDNGLGISKSDISRVMEKGFTGTDRKKEHSSGMGLYLAGKLCRKLGLNLQIESEQGVYTQAAITFPKNSMYRDG